MYGSIPYGYAPLASTLVIQSLLGAGNITGVAVTTATGELAGAGDASGLSSLVVTQSQVAGAGGVAGEGDLAALFEELIASGEIDGVSVLFGFSNLISTGGAIKGISIVGATGEVTGSAGAVIGVSSLYGNPYFPHYNAWQAESLLFSFGGDSIDEVDLAFEQAGRAVVVAQRTILGQPTIWLYWFDPALNVFVFQNLGPGRNPRCLLDDPPNLSNSDVLIFYVTLDTQQIVYRVQRERYAIVHSTPVQKVKSSYIDLYLQEVGKGRDGRLIIIYALHDVTAGKWSYARLESALYPVILYDVDAIKPSANFNSGTLENIVIAEILQDVDKFASSISYTSGILSQIVKYCGPPGTLDPLGNPVPFYDDVDQMQAVDSSFLATSTLLVVLIPITLTDIDEFQAVDANFQSGTLVQIVIVEVLFDIDQFTASISFQSAGSSLA